MTTVPNRHMTTKSQKTNCRLCSYLCGLEATIDNGKIIDLKPDPSRYPYDASIVLGCRRFHSNLEFLNHPDRINYPLKRVGERGSGQWQQVSWEDALDDIAERLTSLKAEFGAETLATAIGGPHTTFWPLHRFMNLFGSPNNVGIGQICWNPSIWVNSLTFGWPLENEIDPDNTECAILWGVNPAESDNSLFWRQVLAYSKTGRPLIVIDPRKTRTAALATHWIAPRPGSDAALALGLLHVVMREGWYDQEFVATWCHGFEQLKNHVSQYTPENVARLTGLEPQTIVTIARCYATARPASIFHGRGIDQIGHNSMQVHRAIASLKGITANIDLPGACHLSGMPEYVPEIDLELTERLRPEQRAKQLGRRQLMLQTYASYERLTLQTMKHGKRLPARYLTSAQPGLVWRAMLESDPYPVRALVVSGSNPLICQADTKLIYKALKSLDLLVALELFPNSVSSLADYVLPMAGSLERPVLQTNAGVANIAYGGPRGIAPLFERRTDFAFWRDLGIRCGQNRDWPWRNFTASLDDIVKPLGMDWEGFCEKGLYAPAPEYLKFEQEENGQPRGFATFSGKIELFSELLQEFGADPLPVHKPMSRQDETFPLVMVSGGRKQPYWASSFRQLETLKKRPSRPEAEVSQQTATDLGLSDGQLVWVETEVGRTRFHLKVIDMRPGVVNVDYGWWFPEQSLTGDDPGGMLQANANLLTSVDFDKSDPLLGQWKYNDLACRVVPVTNAEQNQETVSMTDSVSN